MNLSNDMVECILLGKCFQWLRDKHEIDEQYVIHSTEILWTEEPQNTWPWKKSCRVSVRYRKLNASPNPRRLSKCGIKATAPFDEKMLELEHPTLTE